MRRGLSVVLILFNAILVVLSVIGVWTTEAWWVRTTDFPRLQYGILLILLLGALLVARMVDGTTRLLLACAAVAALIFNGWKLSPYFITDADVAETCPDDQRMRVLIANVQASREETGSLFETVRQADPDLFLVMETDPWWDERLRPLHDRFPYRQQEVQDGFFGMHLLSKVELGDPQVHHPVGADAPPITADVAPGTDAAFRFIGLHPRPPHPSQSARARDAQLMWAALEARQSELPVVLAGDLNSTPWEKVAERLQRVGGLLDPRQVFGYQPTYDAHSWWMSWPLDHLFHQPGVSVAGMQVLPGFGSDHYPVAVDLCHRPSALSPPEASASDIEMAEGAVEARES